MVNNWTKVLFGNKRNRLILVVLFLLILLGAGFVSGNYIRTNILDSESEEKMALLNTTTEIFERWIINEENKIQAIASSEELIHYVKAIDSLENLDETYELLRNSKVAREATKWFQKEGKRTRYGLITLLSNTSPKVLLGNSLVDSTGISAQLNEDLGEIIYKDYLKAKNGEIVFIPPINNYDLINNFKNIYGEDVHREAWINFLCPVFDEDETGNWDTGWFLSGKIQFFKYS